MYKAIKANRVVDIPESKAESYLAEGYSIFDKAGNLVLAPNHRGRETFQRGGGAEREERRADSRE